MKLIFIHGNGGCTADMHWYILAARAFREKGLDVVRRTMPDNQIAHESIWIPFIRDELQADEQSILVGHSSGAIAAMRYAEQYPVYGTVLVAGYHTDLGHEDEKAGGWFDRPWNWQSIKNNQNWIIQFASTDDWVVPVEEARFVAKQLQSDYYEFSDRKHFTGYWEDCEFPELVEAVLQKLEKGATGIQ